MRHYPAVFKVTPLPAVELETKVHEVFIITEKAPTKVATQFHGYIVSVVARLAKCLNRFLNVKAVRCKPI